MSEHFDEICGGESARCWQALVQPVSAQTEVELVAADLDRDGVVDLSTSGTILHSKVCHATHRLRPELLRLDIPETVFLVKVLYRNPPGHPIAWAVSPEIAPSRYPGHPHFFLNGSLCPLLPKDGTWRWRSHTMADYLNHVSLWLFKSQVWIVTEQRSGKGIWIGSDVSHRPQNLLAIILPEDECHCGSGKRYKKCCRPRDALVAATSQPPPLGII